MPTKQKLRTCSDVISRLRWSDCNETVLIGYDDRINGPMEVLLDDYSTIKQGGDLPEHRIWYVRTSSTVLWDRLGRVDTLYESGNGKDAPIAQETLEHIERAKATTIRLEAEKLERRKLKEKDRLRRARQRETRAAHLNPGRESVQKPIDRFQWTQCPSFVLVSDCWVENQIQHSIKPTNRVNIVTWNVLFDLYDIGETEVETTTRWAQLIDELVLADADVVALQEVTPSFLSLLLKNAFVRDHYSLTASASDYECVSPAGNLLLWKTSLFRNLASFSCLDGERQRAVVSVLQSHQNTFIVANVHLPGNKGQENRRIARQRELSAVLAQVERLKKTNAIPMILGDFNDEDTLLDTASFTDAWRAVSRESGYTFDPQSNPMAARTRQLTRSDVTAAKRLDRIYFGDDMRATTGSILGKESPSSDHFGVAVSLERTAKSLSTKTSLWSRHAVSTPDTLLALVIGPEAMPDCLHYDNGSSSLPIPHLTLLHSFVEVSGCLDVVENLLAEAINMTSLAADANPSLLVTQDSIGVFEHSSSATLVCRPGTKEPLNHWLLQLYHVLRSFFPQCHEQESRFAEGWTPHVSLGSFGTASGARTKAGQTLLSESPVLIPVYGISVLERSSVDGMFHNRTAVPFLSSPGARRLAAGGFSSFLSNAGAALNSSFRGFGDPILWEVQQACEQIEPSSRIAVYGSHAMGASLPAISDVDVAVEITEQSSLSQTEYLLAAADFLQKRHPKAKIRVREAIGDTNGTKLRILTIRLWSGAPAVDLQVSFRHSNGTFRDLPSVLSWNGVLDTRQTLRAVPSVYHDSFRGALRLIKMWAHCRQVYGMGFLGGGGYAVWIARVLLDALADKAMEDTSRFRDSHFLATYFLAKASEWPSDPITVVFPGSSDSENGQRLPISVLAPASGNVHGRAATRSTALTLITELRRAARIIEIGNELSWSDRIERLKDALDSKTNQNFASILVFEVSGGVGGIVMADLKARAGHELISLVVELEHRLGDPSILRPYLRPKRVGDLFVWQIGLTRRVSNLLPADWCDRKAAELGASLAPATATLSYQDQLA